MSTHDKDELARRIVRMHLETLTRMVHYTLMLCEEGPVTHASKINSMLKSLEYFCMDENQSMQWPDPTARMLQEAKQDKGLQKVLSRCNNTTPFK